MTDFSDETKALMKRFVERDHHYVSEAGRTKLLLHNEVRPKAILLFHGLSASPTQFDRFATELHARGHNVVVPRLPRHGHEDRMSEALRKMNASELRQFASDSVELGRGLGETVVVAGFSLGGLLAVWIAQRYPIERAVAVAPFLGISWVPNRYIPMLTLALLALPNHFPWWNPFTREKQYPEHGYPRYATHALAEALKLASEVIERADDPIAANELILVTNTSEAAVNNRAIHQLDRRLRKCSAAQLAHVKLTDLPISHDIIEPLRHPEIAAKVFPEIMRLIEEGA